MPALHLNDTRSVRRGCIVTQPELIQRASFAFRLRTIQTDVLLLVTELTFPQGHIVTTVFKLT